VSRAEQADDSGETSDQPSSLTDTLLCTGLLVLCVHAAMFLLCSLDILGNLCAAWIYIPRVSPVPLETAYVLGCMPWAFGLPICLYGLKKGRFSCRRFGTLCGYGSHQKAPSDEEDEFYT
jgi:hypothetical protein